MSEQTPKNWYREITTRINSLSETFGLDDMQTSDLRTFVVNIAKDQYKIGNKSGAAWAFKQKREDSISRSQANASA